MSEPNNLELRVQRRIRASPARLFEAWTTPEQLRSWWGPRGVTCTHAEVDLRVGGHYRIENAIPDGSTVVISGEFLVVAPPTKLVYTWRVLPGDAAAERVTIQFEAVGAETDVCVLHQRIAEPAVRDGHQDGWIGCLEGLEDFAGAP